MDLIKNHFKARLKAGERQIGFWNTLPDSGLVELLANCGFDWLLIDSEHSPLDPAAVMPLLQASDAYPTAAIVRPGWNDKVEIKRLLDIGAQTLLVPYVQNAEEARAAVAAVRYPPRGVRGVAGGSRAGRYGAIDDYVARAEEEICLLVQVETSEAATKIDEIAAVDGVDGIFIGPADLAASMGHTGAPGHPEVRQAVCDAVRRIAAAGKPAGFLSGDQDYVREVAEAGATFLAVGVDAALMRRQAVALRKSWG
ncbi:MAG: 4-hydroxy-2-oxo-heptane-1,7-dioate aldolase [Rhodobacteraceae bacterium]|nr:MAG: 4-hydroxy-2-oxo-heptane-1,7-dioate aldolase [Paracoccaceae bacterium]